MDLVYLADTLANTPDGRVGALLIAAALGTPLAIALFRAYDRMRRTDHTCCKRGCTACKALQ